jgi:hypothetical protein
VKLGAQSRRLEFDLPQLGIKQYEARPYIKFGTLARNVA